MDHDYAQFGIADMQCYTTQAPEVSGVSFPLAQFVRTRMNL